MRTNILPVSRDQWRTKFLWMPALALLLGIGAVARAQDPATVPAPAPAATPAPDAAAPTAAAQTASPAQSATPDAAVPPAQDQAAPADQTAPTTEAPPAAGDAAKPGTAPAAPGTSATAKKVDAKATKGHHVPKPKKVKPPPMVPVTIERGVLTVDGWTGKAGLNYSIMDLKFIYLWAPGIGTAVVSSEPFGNAVLQPGAFNGHTLTVTVAGHTLQVASDRDLLSGKELIKGAYVSLDADYVPDSPNYPQFGYGVSSKAPYAWPASMANYTGDVARSPPLPPTLLPPLKVVAKCPPGTPVPATPAAATSATAGAAAPAAAPIAATAPVPATASASGTVPATAAIPANCAVAPVVMYPGKEAKHEEALSKKEKKQNEKLDDSFK